MLQESPARARVNPTVGMAGSDNVDPDGAEKTAAVRLRVRKLPSKKRSRSTGTTRSITEPPARTGPASTAP